MSAEGPVRMCVICRRRFKQAELSRFVAAPGGESIEDGGRHLPGRGFYCCPDPRCKGKFASWRPKRRPDARGQGSWALTLGIDNGKAARRQGGMKVEGVASARESDPSPRDASSRG